MKGRKPKQESRAPEFYGRLAAWKQMPQSSRPSLRALARQLDTSHQLLSHYLQRWEKWHAKECTRRAKEIRGRAEAENRSLTTEEEASVAAYERAACGYMFNYLLRDKLKSVKQQAKSGKLSGRMLENYVEELGKTGYRKEAEQLLKLALISEIEGSG